MSGPLALPVVDPEGGYDVLDTRSGRALAWRHDVASAYSVAQLLNKRYPSGSVAPAHDSLVHEIVMSRVGDGPEPELAELDSGQLSRMVPAAIGGPTDPGLWRPRGEC